MARGRFFRGRFCFPPPTPHFKEAHTRTYKVGRRGVLVVKHGHRARGWGLYTPAKWRYGLLEAHRALLASLSCRERRGAMVRLSFSSRFDFLFASVVSGYLVYANFLLIFCFSVVKKKKGEILRIHVL